MAQNVLLKKVLNCLTPEQQAQVLITVDKFDDWAFYVPDGELYNVVEPLVRKFVGRLDLWTATTAGLIEINGQHVEAVVFVNRDW